MDLAAIGEIEARVEELAYYLSGFDRTAYERLLRERAISASRLGARVGWSVGLGETAGATAWSSAPFVEAFYDSRALKLEWSFTGVAGYYNGKSAALYYLWPSIGFGALGAFYREDNVWGQLDEGRQPGIAYHPPANLEFAMLVGAGLRPWPFLRVNVFYGLPLVSKLELTKDTVPQGLYAGDLFSAPPFTNHVLFAEVEVVPFPSWYVKAGCFAVVGNSRLTTDYTGSAPQSFGRQTVIFELCAGWGYALSEERQ